MAVWIGNLRRWHWVNSVGFRLTHLAVIAVVVGESWAGITCPLTSLEGWLREQAGIHSYQGGFIEHNLQQLLFFEAPIWVFGWAYTLFALLVLATWWRFPPRDRK